MWRAIRASGAPVRSNKHCGVTRGLEFIHFGEKMYAVLALHEVRVGRGGAGGFACQMPEHVRILDTMWKLQSKTHSPLISSRLMQRRACPAPTVGVGRGRLFFTTSGKSRFG